jgi:hypothetical protein
LTSVLKNVFLFHGEAPFVSAAAKLQTAHLVYHRHRLDGFQTGELHRRAFVNELSAENGTQDYLQ